MKTPRVIPLLLVAALSVSACSLQTRPDRVDYRHSRHDTTISVIVDRAPPAPLVEHPPKIALARHFWAPGYWSWQGTGYSWVRGNWQPERPGYTHVASHWERRGDRWHFNPARFEEHRATHTAQTRREEEKAPARHTEHRAAMTQTPDVHVRVRRSEPKPAAPSVEYRTGSSPGMRTAEKSRTEVTQSTKTVEKAAPGKAPPVAVRQNEKRDIPKDVQRVGQINRSGSVSAATS